MGAAEQQCLRLQRCWATPDHNEKLHPTVKYMLVAGLKARL